MTRVRETKKLTFKPKKNQQRQINYMYLLTNFVIDPRKDKHSIFSHDAAAFSSLNSEKSSHESVTFGSEAPGVSTVDFGFFHALFSFRSFFVNGVCSEERLAHIPVRASN